MKRGYYLSTCSTCCRILNELNTTDIELLDIKTKAITKTQIEEMYEHTSSYEALFNKRAMKYKSMDLKNKNLKEEDFKNLISSEYTFLKRPVFIIDDKIFVGNAKKTIQSLKDVLDNE